MSSSPLTLIPVDLTMSAAPFGWGGLLPDFAQLFYTSLSGVLDPTFLIGKTYGTTPTHDIGPYFDGDEWWYFDPLTGQYQPGEQGCAIGTIAMFGGDAVPARWLEIYGQDVSRRTYSRLFQAIGETWGPGDGQSTFTMPPGGKIFISAAGFVALSQVPIDTPPNVPSTVGQQGLGGSEAEGNEAIQGGLLSYPNQGVGARGGSPTARSLIASDMPGLNPYENSGLIATIHYQNPIIENALPPTIPGPNIPNIQAFGSPNFTANFPFPVSDVDGNNLDASTSVPIMPPYQAIMHIIKYQ